MNPHISSMLEEQCGCLLKKGARDAVFNIKIMLQIRKEQDLESCTLSIDLVKAFDAVDHDLIFAALKKNGFPDPLINVIRKMYKKLALKIEKGEEVSFVDYLIGVHQGDNLASLLFVVVFMAAMQTLEHTCIEQSAFQIPIFNLFPRTASESNKGRLKG